jgi:hypothetical protein
MPAFANEHAISQSLQLTQSDALAKSLFLIIYLPSSFSVLPDLRFLPFFVRYSPFP